MSCAPSGFRALPLSVTQLSLAAVLQCGQSFRWSIFPLCSSLSCTTCTDPSPTHEYRLCLRDRVVCLRQSPDTLFYRSVFPDSVLLSNPKAADRREADTLAWIQDYFQLDVDLVSLYEQWGKRDPVFQNCKERFGGIRMLRQDPFENLISFICSSNNNIARITKMVKVLCQHYSPPLVTLPAPAHEASSETSTQEPPLTQVYHPFPSPSVLAGPEVAATLRGLGFGYRADFIQKTCKMLVDSHGALRSEQDSAEPAEKWLQTLRDMPTSDARGELLKFVGVGRKVADCILLMSLDKNEVIPVDTHVHQIAMKHYGVSGSSKGKTAMTPKLYDEVSTKLAAVWGGYAGWAHSVLFTSDLKSFSSYGLPSPSPSPSVQIRRVRVAGKTETGLVTPPDTPSSSTGKRKRGQIAEVTVVAEEQAENSLDTSSVLPAIDGFNSSMADRVKRRRRVKVMDLSISSIS